MHFLVWAHMDNTTRLLKVPQELSLRKQLRKEVSKYFSKTDLLPPVKFEILEQLAKKLLKDNNISLEYTDYTIVLLGNESWRKTVKATPIHRRLLLLPQCLKNSTNCKATFDQLGLICAGCKGCMIDDILTEAEQLGYATLVAEGTTVAIGLVEEGSIDAVIGVSCMSVLQRSFQPVSNAAVPVIGIPLLFDGCVDTKVDKEWLLDEIRSFQEDPINKPISISLLRHQITKFFTEEQTSIFFPWKNDTEKLAQEYLLIDGQRMRPLLAGLSYLAYSDKEHTDEMLLPLSMIIECFHKASLIHDDIEDKAEYRYNNLTAHKKYGIPRAINAGDYLIGKGYQILSNLPVDATIIAKGLKTISDSHVILTEGQGTDILMNTENHFLDINSTLHVFKQKTGEAIKVALLLGGILGKADNSELAILEEFSDLFGISYQIRDDINEFNENSINEKTADFPFLTALLFELFNKNEAEMQKINILNVKTFREIIEKENLIPKANDYLNNYIEKCYSSLDSLQNHKLRLSLYSVLGKIFKPLSINE